MNDQPAALRRVSNAATRILVVSATLLVSVSATGNASTEEQLRRACGEFVAAYKEHETLKGLVAQTRTGTALILQGILKRIQLRRAEAEQSVLKHLADDDIDRLDAIARVQEAIRTVREDGNWPSFGDVPKLLSELDRKAELLHEAALVQLCK